MKRYSVRLPEWHLKRFIWWAEAKGQTIAGMAQNVLQNRVEVNEDQIERMAAEIASDCGLTVNEWKQRMLEKNNYEPGDDYDPSDDSNDD